MKIFTTLLLAIIAHFSVAQISFFKELNTQEEGSSPANFTEVNGITFFSVKTIEGYNLWKTDGTEAGTVVVSDKLLVNLNQEEILNTLQVINDELYYFVYSSISLNRVQLWKTDGVSNTMVIDNLFTTKLYLINNQICYFQYNGVYKIENQQSIRIKDLSSNSFYSQPPPVELTNQTIFFTQEIGVSNRIQVWKTDGTEVGTSLVKNIDSLYYFPGSNRDYEKVSIGIDGQAYFILKRVLILANDNYTVATELWKTDGTNTLMVKRFAQTNGCCNDYNQAVNLANFNGNLLFIYANAEIWISGGTNNNTIKLKNLTASSYDFYNRKWGIIGNKFYFSDGELWQSDGTVAGTTLLKDINPSGNSNPNYFTTLNNRLFFKANNDELWQSDGTETGTTFVLNIPKPANSADSYRVTPEFVYTSTNQLYFSNYDAINDFELWKSDGTIQNTGLLKNITTRSKGSNLNDKKIKIGNIWYFSATDHRGTELWKSDGTPEGTTIVKDITAGSFSTFIREMVSINNEIYFIASSTNENINRLYKTNGTSAGTSEITLVSNNSYPVSPKFLTVSGTKLFFRNDNGSQLWVSDGTNFGTNPIPNPNLNYNPASNITPIVGGKIMFTANGLWVSDGTVEGTFMVFGNDRLDVPLNPLCLVELNGKIYFFSFYQSSPNYTIKYALFKSDGTRAGTEIVKIFSESDKLTDTYLLFLEKSADKLYFRAGFSSNYGSQYFDLWTSNGTETGTYKLKRIPFTGSNFNFKFANVGNQFYMFLTKQFFASGTDLWTSNGTIEGTNQVFQYSTSSVGSSSIAFNNKLYFNLFNGNYGLELWATDGTNNGTSLVEEVRPNAANSYVNNLMDFNEKLLFWASDNTRGSELWQYLPPFCEVNRNYTVQSGSWNNPTTWFCGRVPIPEDTAIIKSGHTITIPNNYQTTIKGISTENGAILNIPQSAVFTVNPR